jgi:beta-galactosidase
MGSGITGLWRPLPNTGDATGFIASINARGETLFTLRQDGSSLTGTVEGSDSDEFGAKNEPLPIEEGKVEGDSISFRLGRNMFSGTVKSDRIELLQKADSALQPPGTLNTSAVRRPAIGPPPDGSDPSAGPGGETPPSPFALHRVQR